MLFDPGVERRCGVREMQRWVALHQGEGGFKGAQCRLPGVGHRPEPGQIEVCVPEHMHYPWRTIGNLLLEPWLQCRR